MTQPIALLLTLVLESLLVLPLLRATGWGGHRSPRDLVLIVCAASLLTHPFAWFFIVEWRDWQPEFWLRALPVEAAVGLVEGGFYAWMLKLPPHKGLVVGLAANAFSFGLGLVLDGLDVF